MTPCTGCRVRHLKCDGQDTCAHCLKAGRDCARGYNIRFRNLVCPAVKGVTPADYSKYEFFFSRDQIWVDVQDKLEFVVDGDFGMGVISSGNVDDDGEIVRVDGPFEGEISSFSSLPRPVSALKAVAMEENPTTGLGSSSPPIESSAYHERNGSFPASLQRLITVPTPCERHQHATRNSVKCGITHGRLRSVSIGSFKSLATPQSTPNNLREAGSVYQTPPSSALLNGLSPNESSNFQVWPLRNLAESKLMQHFVDHLAPWFDAIDSKRHFSRTVPRMAASSPLLMNSVLAIASLHLSHITDHNLSDTVHYHNQCLKLLVPMLDDDEMIKDDALLLTTVILHLYEDLDMGLDSSRHIQGMSQILAARGACQSSQLRTAVYWCHLRMEIYAAAIAQRPVQADLERSGKIASFEPAEDEIWCHRTLWICAHVLQWAYGEEPTHARWRELLHYVNEWERLRPNTFDALYYRSRNPKEGRWFPEICLATDEHVVGIHFLFIAKVHLVAHDPTIPRMGPQAKPAMAEMQEATLSHVRAMIGIALCSTYIPARFSASLAICVCGSWFTDPQEQKQLIDFMRDTERLSGCPRENAVKILIADWAP